MRCRLFPWLVLTGLLASTPALAQSILKNPGQHPQGPELEPHLVLGPFHHSGAVGPGFRATFQIGKNNFIDSINNSVGIGVGIDWMPVCGGGCSTGSIAIPVVMQWSFYLSKAWSVFGEPGVVADMIGSPTAIPMFQAGGRWHFQESITLTMRIGWPYWSVGVSFLLPPLFFLVARPPRTATLPPR
ncbi:MAG: hypothetical protein RMJ98_13790 [Myxococcales bacterium]|nr:hypothetical protein [Polyangiaceae bacterium]MDW8250363.1 hypothetical protein [Myxococcales bacterium]